MQNNFQGKNILITGHTGSNGMELSQKLVSLGAVVFGFALPTNMAETNTSGVISMFGDIRNKESLLIALETSKPEFIFHLAESDDEKEPYQTFEINVIGTLNLLDLTKNLKTLKSIAILSSEKNKNNAIYIASKQAESIAVNAYESLLTQNNINLSFEEIDNILEIIQNNI